MPSQIVKVASTVGLHARPAKLLATAAKSAGIPITIGKVGENRMAYYPGARSTPTVASTVASPAMSRSPTNSSRNSRRRLFGLRL